MYLRGMKYMLLLFIHLLSQLVFAQGNLTKIKYPNGQIQSIGKFNLAGKEDSIWNYYYENGALQLHQRLFKWKRYSLPHEREYSNERFL